MNFLYPGFLFALLSVAIPVIIHLFNFRKFKKVYFSNVQLLKSVEQQQSSSEKIKNLLVLIARILALTFLVLAFAQPYIPIKRQKSVSLSNLISIYIDNSYSMEAVNKDGSLLDEAKRRAKELVKSFGLNDKFQLLTNDFEGKHQRLLSAEAFLKALDDVKISAASRNIQQIIHRQENILTGSVNKYAFLLSDFQVNMANNQKLQTKPDINYAFLKLNASNLANVAVDSVWTLSPNHQPNAQERLVVRLKNYANEEAKNIPLKLSINNQQKAVLAVSVAAQKSITDTLNFSGLAAGWQKAQLSIKDFPVVFDDTLSFSFKVDASLAVLSINGEKGGNYIKALFGADNYYKLTENPESNINYSAFGNFSLIVLNGLKNPSSGLAQQLQRYLKAGGSVVIFPDLDADIKVYNSFFAALSLPQAESVSKTADRVDQIDLQNPIFKSVFEEIPKNLDLPTANRYFLFVNQNSGNREDILSMPGRKLFFAKFGGDNGQIFLAATGLNTLDGNLARHPVFVPLMYRIALNGGDDTPLYYNIGQENNLAIKKITLGKNQSLKLSAAGFEAIPEMRQVAGKTIIYAADQVKNAGFYQLSLADSLLAVYSFNSKRTESDMHYLSKADLENLADKGKINLFDADKDAIKLLSGVNPIGKTLWKLCLILSLLFIAAEIILIRFFNNTKKAI